MTRNMKLTKTTNRKVGNETYYKFIITVPNKHLEKLGWDDKTTLNMKVISDRIIIEKS